MYPQAMQRTLPCRRSSISPLAAARCCMQRSPRHCHLTLARHAGSQQACLVPGWSLRLRFLVSGFVCAALVAREKEPITPFIARIRALVSRGVSSVLVMGGAGDYFGVRWSCPLPV